MAIKLIYKDEIPGAAEGASVSVSVEAENFSTPSLLPFGADTGGIATLEPNGWGLNRDYKVKDNQSFGFWSSEISDENGDFANPPVITVTLDKKYILPGITLNFSPVTGEFCKTATITLFNDGSEVYVKDFVINDSLFDVEFDGAITFDKIVATINKTNFPHRRAKIELLRCGIVRDISASKIETLNLINEVSLIADTIPRNVIDATFHTGKQTNIVFQNGQALELYEDKDMVSKYFIDDGKQEGQTVYSVSASDQLDLLENYQYYPSYRENDGIWFKPVLASTILNNILGGMYEFELSPELTDVKLQGYCQEGSMSNALRQVAFALGAYIDVLGQKIKISKVNTTRTSEIPAAETFADGVLENMKMVTSVTVRGCYIENVHPEDSYHPYYVQTPNGAYVYTGFSQKIENPNKTEITLPNDLVFTGNYLISSKTQAAELANYIMDLNKRQRKYTFSHVDRGQQVGDHVKCFLPWGEPTSGIITKKSIKYSGIKVSETTVLLDD